jgi:hypothetical protein
LTATDAQVRIALSERKKGKTQQQAAAKANLRCRDTVAKYEKAGKLPSELKQPRTYRTREDPFADDWPLARQMLEAAPGLEAKALFEWLCDERPGCYTEGQLRTFQRRVSEWKARHVPQILTLEQDRVPGEMLQTDGTSMNVLRVTIRGEPFPHELIHSALPYSNWEWGSVAQSESLVALTRGFQSAVTELGHVPKVHQTDNTTAATHNLKVIAADGERAESGRVYNDGYLALLEHYGVMPRTTHLDSPDENGDIEAAHGALKRAVEQHLLLRGSRDFESIEEYESFLRDIMRRRNELRADRVAKELEVMRPLSVHALPEMREYRLRVSESGTIRVLGNVYSVPSGLKKRQVAVRVYEWHIDVYFGSRRVQRMPRLLGKKRSDINYRHIIDTLLRKPGGFRRYRYREQMFPTPVFREAWEVLAGRMSPRRADLAYLKILKLAANNLETDVELALKLALKSGERWDDDTIVGLVRPTLPSAPHIDCGEVDLAEYDSLMRGGGDRDAA